MLKSEPEYPPRRHLEADIEKMYAVVRAFPFATLVSNNGGDVCVTHAPLTIDRSRGAFGVLFGHMDKFNPHLAVLDEQKVLAIFHGPNGYITPHVYRSKQLPTWNSISVHVRGTVTRLATQEETIAGLMGICEQVDQGVGAYRLNADDERIPSLINFIEGFEITIEEMIGRFKLSQDRNDDDRKRANEELARQSELGSRSLIEFVTSSEG